jgi:hypothetical protein
MFFMLMVSAPGSPSGPTCSATASRALGRWHHVRFIALQYTSMGQKTWAKSETKRKKTTIMCGILSGVVKAFVGGLELPDPVMVVGLLPTAFGSSVVLGSSWHSNKLCQDHHRRSHQVPPEQRPQQPPSLSWPSLLSSLPRSPQLPSQPWPPQPPP